MPHQLRMIISRWVYHCCTILILALLYGCSSEDSPVSENNATSQAETNPPLQLPQPMPYNETPEDKLGANENAKGLDVGTMIEDIVLKDVQGNDYHLADAWREKPALVVFYRGGWCPYCNTQVRELSERHDDFVAAGVQPVLISVDVPEKAAMVETAYDIPFPVLSDPKLVAHNQFNVVLQLDEPTLVKYKEYGIDLSLWSGEHHNAIAVASAFLIDTSGRVMFSHAPEDYTSRPSANQLLALIEQKQLAE